MMNFIFGYRNSIWLVTHIKSSSNSGNKNVMAVTSNATTYYAASTRGSWQRLST